MRATDRYPNLRSTLWDTVRVPARNNLRQMAEQMCRDADFDPDTVRQVYTSRKITPPGLVALRCKIVATLYDAGFRLHEMQYQWFVGFKTTTLQDYLYDGRKLLRESEDA